MSPEECEREAAKRFGHDVIPLDYQNWTATTDTKTGAKKQVTIFLYDVTTEELTSGLRNIRMDTWVDHILISSIDVLKDGQ